MIKSKISKRLFTALCLICASVVMMAFTACKSSRSKTDTKDESSEKQSNTSSIDGTDRSDAIYLPEVP